MITPSQIKEKVLSTASHGYDIDETNEFLQQIEESFSAIYDENKELYRKMEILAAKIEEYRAEEDSIKDTLLTAQKAASKVEKEAQEKSEKLLADSANTVPAYGDYYSWFRNILMWPYKNIMKSTEEETEMFEKKILPLLEEEASKIKTTENSPVAVDWINGRRTPFANQNLYRKLT